MLSEEIVKLKILERDDYLEIYTTRNYLTTKSFIKELLVILRQ